jgi:uncharacterized membrane protein
MKRHRHPVNRRLVDEAPLGARIAETATRFIGSWKFVVIQTAFVTVWVAINIGFITGLIPFDPYPFILLNLAFSTQAAYAAPLILIASNRSADHDRLVLEHIVQVEARKDDRLTEIRRLEKEILDHVSRLESLMPPMKPSAAPDVGDASGG